MPQKNTTQIGSRSRWIGVRVITKVNGGGEAQRTKLGKMKGERSLKIKAQITKKQLETQGLCKKTQQSAHATWQGHT